ncbi:MAG: xanthine dehydrogenase accessory protein XdhC [Pseudomonadota bacterium]
MTILVDELNKFNTLDDVTRIVIVDHKGSTPRETSTSMLVAGGNTFGTIGGGALELDAVQKAQNVQKTGKPVFLIYPLGPKLGQCCGGSVSLVIEPLHTWSDCTGKTHLSRQITGTSPKPLVISKAEANVRNGQETPKILYQDGWLFEPIRPEHQPVWIYGAGHVGRALVEVLYDLPYEITWIDTDRTRFPDEPLVDPVVAKDPTEITRFAPPNAIHLVLTYSHAIDLALCHNILGQPHAALGLIGSATKRKRFSARLAALGHKNDQISRIICPIGEPNLGKEPKMIAIGVARQLHLLRMRETEGMLPHNASA